MLNLEKLKKIRELKGLSQSGLARRCNITPSHYNNIERGLKGVSNETLSIICQILQISISDIWDENKSLPPIIPIRDSS